MIEENLDEKQVESDWFIDLDWYQKNDRSFFMLAQGCLCPKCHERLSKGEIPSADLMANIKDCCSKLPGFISSELTILEIIFRLFLGSGNRPLSLMELSKQLSELLERNTYRTSVEVLSRLLEDELYYGIRRCST